MLRFPHLLLAAALIAATPAPAAPQAEAHRAASMDELIAQYQADLGALVWDDSFDLADPAAQAAVLRACARPTAVLLGVSPELWEAASPCRCLFKCSPATSRKVTRTRLECSQSCSRLQYSQRQVQCSPCRHRILRCSQARSNRSNSWRSDRSSRTRRRSRDSTVTWAPHLKHTEAQVHTRCRNCAVSSSKGWELLHWSRSVSSSSRMMTPPTP